MKTSDLEQNIRLPGMWAVRDWPIMETALFSTPQGLTFFVDEHNHQWVKFIPTNGPSRGEETIIRTVGLCFSHKS